MAKNSLSIEGDKELMRAINRKANALLGELSEYLNLRARVINRRAQKITPRRTGRLRQSAYITRATRNRLVATTGYTTPYAGYVHNFISPLHPNRKPINFTTPKTSGDYLQIPWNKNKEDFKSGLERKIRKHFSGS